MLRVAEPTDFSVCHRLGRLNRRIGIGGEFTGGRITGVDGSFSHQNHHLALRLSEWFVLHPLWHDKHLAGVERHSTITKVDSQLAFDDEERFIGVRMTVPNEVAFELGEFEMKAVYLGDDLRRPLVGEPGQLGRQIDRRWSHVLSGGVVEWSISTRKRSVFGESQ